MCRYLNRKKKEMLEIQNKYGKNNNIYFSYELDKYVIHNIHIGLRDYPFSKPYITINNMDCVKWFKHLNNIYNLDLSINLEFEWICTSKILYLIEEIVKYKNIFSSHFKKLIIKNKICDKFDDLINMKIIEYI